MNDFLKLFFVGVFCAGLFCSASVVLAKECGSEGCDAQLKELREVANGTRPPSKLVWREVKARSGSVKKKTVEEEEFSIKSFFAKAYEAVKSKFN